MTFESLAYRLEVFCNGRWYPFGTFKAKWEAEWAMAVNSRFHRDLRVVPVESR